MTSRPSLLLVLILRLGISVRVIILQCVTWLYLSSPINFSNQYINIIKVMSNPQTIVDQQKVAPTHFQPAQRLEVPIGTQITQNQATLTIRRFEHFRFEERPLNLREYQQRLEQSIREAKRVHQQNQQKYIEKCGLVGGKEASLDQELFESNCNQSQLQDTTGSRPHGSLIHHSSQSLSQKDQGFQWIIEKEQNLHRQLQIDPAQPAHNFLQDEIDQFNFQEGKFNGDALEHVAQDDLMRSRTSQCERELDFMAAAKFIRHLKDMKAIQHSTSQIKRADADLYYMNQFKVGKLLDAKGVAIKKIIPDVNSVFRLVGDYFTFSQVQYQQIKTTYAQYLALNQNQFEQVLDMTFGTNGALFERKESTSQSQMSATDRVAQSSQLDQQIKATSSHAAVLKAEEYLQKLLRDQSTDSEVDLVMLCFIHKLSLSVVFTDQNFQLYEYTLSIRGSEHTLQLSTIDGQYDLIYSREYLSRAAQMQKFVKSVINSAVYSSAKEGASSELKVPEIIDPEQVLTPMTLEDEDELEKIQNKVDVYINEPYLQWLQSIRVKQQPQEQENSSSKKDSKKSRMVAFLEDEKEDGEIVIKGAIKKSSLSGVHKYLEGHEDKNLLEENPSQEKETLRPRQNSLQLFSADDIAEEENEQNDSSSEEQEAGESGSSHHSQSIFTQDPFGLHENFDINDKFDLKLSLQNQTAEPLKGDGSNTQQHRFKPRLSSSHDLLPTFNEILPGLEKKISLIKALENGQNVGGALTQKPHYGKQPVSDMGKAQQNMQMNFLQNSHDLSNLSKEEGSNHNLSDSLSYKKLANDISQNGLKILADLRGGNDSNGSMQSGESPFMGKGSQARFGGQAPSQSSFAPHKQGSLMQGDTSVTNIFQSNSAVPLDSKQKKKTPSNIRVSPLANEDPDFLRDVNQEKETIVPFLFLDGVPPNPSPPSSQPIHRQPPVAASSSSNLLGQQFIGSRQNTLGLSGQQTSGFPSNMHSQNIQPSNHLMQNMNNKLASQQYYSPNALANQDQSQQYFQQQYPQMPMMQPQIIHQSPNVLIQSSQPSNISMGQMGLQKQNSMMSPYTGMQPPQQMYHQAQVQQHYGISQIQPQMAHQSQQQVMNMSKSQQILQSPQTQMAPQSPNVQVTSSGPSNPMNSSTSHSPIVPSAQAAEVFAKVDQLQKRVLGKIKFYNEAQQYGFIILPDGQEIFAHFDDLIKGGITKELLFRAKYDYTIHVSFVVMNYINKKNRQTKKAVDIQLINIEEPQVKPQPSPQPMQQTINSQQQQMQAPPVQQVQQHSLHQQMQMATQHHIPQPQVTAYGVSPHQPITPPHPYYQSMQQPYMAPHMQMHSPYPQQMQHQPQHIPNQTMLYRMPQMAVQAQQIPQPQPTYHHHLPLGTFIGHPQMNGSNPHMSPMINNNHNND